MIDVKTTVAKNLTELRKSRGLTQAQLAENFNYTDKAICRWERGETLPDINMLCALADFYDVTMNDLVDPDFVVTVEDEKSKNVFKYRLLISTMIVSVIWLFATVIFTSTLAAYSHGYWIAFVWAVPLSCFSISKFWRRTMPTVVKIIINSLFSWTFIASIFLHLLIINGMNTWMMFLIGIPVQLIVIFWQQIKYYKNNI